MGFYSEKFSQQKKYVLFTNRKKEHHDEFNTGDITMIRHNILRRAPACIAQSKNIHPEVVTSNTHKQTQRLIIILSYGYESYKVPTVYSMHYSTRTICSRVLLKMTVAKLVKKFPSFHGT